MGKETGEQLEQKLQTTILLTDKQTAIPQVLTQQDVPQQITTESVTMKKMTDGLPESGNPDGGGDVPPNGPPVVLQEQLAAPKTKAEKKALKRAQETQRLRTEEEQRLQAEEEQQRKQEEKRRQREEARQHDEAVRMEHQHIVTQSEPVADSLMGYLNQQDQKLKEQDAMTYLRTAAQELLDKKPTLAKDFAATASYAGEIPVYRRLIAEQVESDEDFNVMLEMLNDYERRFREVEHENVLMRVISFELPVVMEEHWSMMDVTRAMEQATTAFQDAYREKLNTLMESFTVFDTYIAKKLNLDVDSEENGVNVFSGAFSYAKKTQNREQYEAEIQLVMEEQNLSPIAAEELVLRQYRTEIKEQAVRKSLDGSIVHNLTPQQWEETGGASTHQTVPAAKALRLVKESGGFLCAKDVGGGLMELHPSLPETVELNGQTIPLRKTYNLMVKSMVRKMLDDKGRLLPDALDSAGGFHGLAMTRTAGPGSVPLEDVVQQFLQPLTELVGEEEATTVAAQIHTLINNLEEFPPREIMRNMETFCDNAQKCGIGVPTQQKNPNSLTLLERQQRMLETLFAENGGAPLSQEQKAQVLAVGSMYADMDQAIEELMRIRNMENEDLIVPIPNACSANGQFIQGIRNGCMGSPDVYFTYRTAKQIEADPQKFIEYAATHIDKLEASGGTGFPALITELKQRFDANPDASLSEEEMGILCLALVNHKSAPGKYEYHVAANLGVSTDGNTLTAEGFAAETKQYVVSPFTRQGAVGIYKSAENRAEHWRGSPVLDTINPCMVKYYNHDESMPEDDEMILVQTNQRLRDDQLPGDRNYRPPVKETKQTGDTT